MPQPRRLKLPVACTVVTGALAAGKTTLISRLLHTKPLDEVWVVLVNEFGAAGLDGALLEGSAGEAHRIGGGAIHIHQLAGGCLCCALSNVTALTIAQLLRRFKPDRCDMRPPS
jgi:G3E family GTPase